MEEHEPKTHSEEDIKRLLGMPMGWQPRRIFENYWNPADDRVFPPKYFGVGWDLNLLALAKKLHLVR